ncbi:uncharacterized protein J4E84_006283 [Alternaria hordeiaustralica]|uniref:uncharacterized protein n=1 Tax=Alternaria hordeiaustralica TaxID=1187925 RepID=UPI0020C482B4|nr:uncharacterized protein J4E84_006283 [Alternaria hordeiaustralica]KAI4684295.1 hypothetical protein J4E84_006283 [Alternaria hordeiaustralica]
MDPISALSIATSVVTFIDFTVKVVLLGHEIYQEGTTVGVSEIEHRAQELKSWVNGLRAPISGRKDSLKDEYEAFDRIIAGCAEVGTEIIKYLEDLIPKANKRSVWKSVNIALRTILKKEQIEGLVSRLEGYQQDLSLRLLALLNAKTDLYSSEVTQRLNNLETASNRIVQILTFTQSSSESSASPRDLTGNPESKSENTRREKVLRVILGLEDGTTLSVADQNFAIAGQEDSAPGNSIERVITFRDQSNTGLVETVSNERFSPLSTNVLAALQYRGLQSRFSDTAIAHHETYEWIFKAPEEDRRWSNFAEWLRSGNSLYWISGKAGSGKSTLMKYICSNSETTQLLDLWRDGSTLLQARFFFWAAGHTLQSSHEGLLRGLLYTLLAQCPRLIPSVFPEICTEIVAGRKLDLTWTLPELVQALNLLVENSKGLKICLFIDGLDEYAGDHGELIRIFETLSSYDNLKLVLSSRPLVAFNDAFENMPQLRLQDLTYRDMMKFVSDRLDHSRGLREMEELDPKLRSTLVCGLCDMSAGVFLWVVLALRSILEGLQNGETASSLQLKLDALPPDLHGMYKHMFRSLDPATQTGTARMILLMLRSKDVANSEPISPLQLALADNDDATVEKAITEEVRTMPSNKRRSLCLRMKRRIDGHTKGLLEVRGQDNVVEQGLSSIDEWVEFYHKTAIDFFRSDEIWDLLKTQAGSHFNVDQTLLVSSLLEMKALPSESTLVTETNRSLANMRQGLRFVGFLEGCNLRPHTELLDDMEKTMRLHWAKTTMYKERAKSREQVTENMTFEEFVELQARRPTNDHEERAVRRKQTHPGNMPFELSRFESGVSSSRRKGQPAFLTLAMIHGCYIYVADKVLWDDSVTTEQRTLLTSSLLCWCLEDLKRKDGLARNAVTATLQILDMAAEASINMDIRTCWNKLTVELRSAMRSSVLRSDFANNTMDLCLAFLNNRELRLDAEVTGPGVRRLLREFQSEVMAANPLGAKNDSTQQDLDEFNTKYDKVQTILATGWKEKSNGAQRKQNSEGWKWPGFVFMILITLSSLHFLSYGMLFSSLGGLDRTRDL